MHEDRDRTRDNAPRAGAAHRPTHGRTGDDLRVDDVDLDAGGWTSADPPMQPPQEPPQNAREGL